MAVLMIMRHAKSDWSAGVATDHDRPLAPRGIEAAGVMGRFLARYGHSPNLVLTSTAVRARSTVELAAAAGSWGCEILSMATFYGCDPKTALGELTAASELPERVLIVGHEPAWSDLLALLGGGRVKMPTAAVACVVFDGRSWREIAPGRGVLHWLVTPKLVKGLV
jgi:phosphohistidine phosphatase